MAQPYKYLYGGQESPPTKNGSTPHVGWIDNLRVVATLATITLHVASPVVIAINDPRTFAWWIANLIESASRWCVPSFVMISGYLLLTPRSNDDLGAFYRHRIGRILIPLIWWTVFFLAWSGLGHYIQTGKVDWSILGQRLLLGKPYYHLWYLYMLPSLYLFSPFLQCLVHGIPLRNLIFLCVVFFIFSIGTDAAIFWLNYPDPFFFCQFLYYSGYYLAGYVLGSINPRISNRLLWMILAGAVICTAVGCFWIVAAGGDRTSIYVYNYLSPTVVPMVLATFVLIKRASEHRPSSMLVSGIAPLTFGIYLVHPIWLDILKIVHVTGTTFQPWFTIPGLVLLIFLASLVTASVLLRLPIVRRVIL